MNNRAKPADLELTDDEIEALALKHIAPGYERLRAVVPEFAPYQQSEQFRRVKALIGDVLSKLQAPVIDLRPHLEWALGRIRASLDTGDKYEAAQAALDAAKAAPQASANDFAKLQRAYVGACDQIAELLARKQASAENAPVAGEAIGYVDSLYLACRLRGLPCNGTIHRTPTSDATAPIYAAPQASAEDVRNAALEEAAKLMDQTLRSNGAALIRGLIRSQADKDGGQQCAGDGKTREAVDYPRGGALSLYDAASSSATPRLPSGWRLALALAIDAIENAAPIGQDWPVNWPAVVQGLNELHAALIATHAEQGAPHA